MGQRTSRTTDSAIVRDRLPEASRLEYPEGKAWRMADLPERLRPREEMTRLGAENVSDVVLLAVLLRSGRVGVNVADAAQQLLREYGSLTALAKASVKELASKKALGIGPVKAQVLKAALEIGRRLAEEDAPRRPYVRTPGDVADVLRRDAVSLNREVFWVLPLDARNHLSDRPLEVTRGLLDASLVHPREMFREAIIASAAAVILAHNHPSGDPTPSGEDVRITKQLVDAGRIIGIKVLDHVVLGTSPDPGRQDYMSLRESGLVDFG